MSQGMHAVACPLSSTDNQTQKTGKFGEFMRFLQERFRSRENVQVYLAVDTPKGVDTAVMKLCEDMYYNCKIIGNINDLQHDVRLIVVCPVTSRLEPDIDHALNGLDWHCDFIALVLHQGNEDSLPGLPTATRLPKKPKYDKATFVDIAFSFEFYACKMNEDAKQTIKEKLSSASALPSTDRQPQQTGRVGELLRFLQERFRSREYVQVYLAIDTPKGVDTAVMKLCEDMYYKCKIIENTNDLQQDVRLIVVCPVTSRLEPDIDQALNGLDWESAFIALVLHQGNEDSLPGLPTATRLPKKPKYVNAQFVDIAYSLELYAFKMNEDAKQTIKKMLDAACPLSSTNKQTQKPRKSCGNIETGAPHRPFTKMT